MSENMNCPKCGAGRMGHDTHQGIFLFDCGSELSLLYGWHQSQQCEVDELKAVIKRLTELYRSERSYAAYWDLNIRYKHDQETEANIKAAAGEGK